MNFNTYTIKSQEAIQAALQLASTKSNPNIETAHLLLGIFEVDEHVISFLFKKLNANVSHVQKAIEKITDGFPKTSGGSQPQLSNAAHQALTKAQNYLKEFNDEYVTIEHLVLALASGSDVVAQLLKDAGLNEKELKKVIKEFINIALFF